MIAVASKVILKKLPDENTTAGGLYLPANGVRSTPKGVVLSAPVEYVDNGVLRKTPFRVGSEVIFVLKGATVKVDSLLENDIYCCEMGSILCVIKE